MFESERQKIIIYVGYMYRPFLDLNPNNKVKGVAVRQMIIIRPISPMSHDILVKTLLLPPKSIAKKKK